MAFSFAQSLTLGSLGLTLLCLQVSAALYEDPSQLPARTYDYIVVGCQSFRVLLVWVSLADFFIAGAGGGTVASRLASNHSVLVIEAGVKYVMPCFLSLRKYPANLCIWRVKR